MDDLVEELRNLKEETRYDARIEEAADLIEALENVLRTGARMRAAQIGYFKKRSKENLVEAKRLEREFDDNLRRVSITKTGD